MLSRRLHFRRLSPRSHNGDGADFQSQQHTISPASESICKAFADTMSSFSYATGSGSRSRFYSVYQRNPLEALSSSSSLSSSSKEQPLSRLHRRVSASKLMFSFSQSLHLLHPRQRWDCLLCLGMLARDVVGLDDAVASKAFGSMYAAHVLATRQPFLRWQALSTMDALACEFDDPASFFSHSLSCHALRFVASTATGKANILASNHHKWHASGCADISVLLKHSGRHFITARLLERMPSDQLLPHVHSAADKAPFLHLPVDLIKRTLQHDDTFSQVMVRISSEVVDALAPLSFRERRVFLPIAVTNVDIFCMVLSSLSKLIVLKTEGRLRRLLTDFRTFLTIADATVISGGCVPSDHKEALLLPLPNGGPSSRVRYDALRSVLSALTMGLQSMTVVAEEARYRSTFSALDFTKNLLLCWQPKGACIAHKRTHKYETYPCEMPAPVVRQLIHALALIQRQCYHTDIIQLLGRVISLLPLLSMQGLVDRGDVSSSLFSFLRIVCAEMETPEKQLLLHYAKCQVAKRIYLSDPEDTLTDVSDIDKAHRPIFSAIIGGGWLFY